MNLSFHLRFVGLCFLLLVGINFLIPRRFGWREDFAKVSLLNRQIFYVHSFFIMLVITGMALLNLFGTELLLRRDPLTKWILVGLLTFWSARLFIQLFVYDARLWRGHRFNTVVHVLFTLLWSDCILVYGAALWKQF